MAEKQAADYAKATTVLLEEAKLNEIVKLIGEDVLPDDQKLIMEVARLIRVGLLQQNAYHRDDTYVPLPKQLMMMQVILYFYDKGFGGHRQGDPDLRDHRFGADRFAREDQVRDPQRASRTVRQLL